MYKRGKQYLWWPNIKRDIEGYVTKCQSCQNNKKVKMPMEIKSTLEVAFQKCAIDIVRPMTETEKGNIYLLTCQEDISKYITAIPIPT
ncbi:hypothetical protein PR048_011673 [Dryococelus australis]|uniref:Integrase zinc-binding domain-containing protein n=1 Tax=Dryococelus australis TaxID=614101 RepID=A0ABQ9HMA9_9NEOP|nr:hypothetical protein PR048_011673 [Dryococelus australis]